MASKINMNWVSGLVSALAGKASSTHTHIINDITDYAANGVILQIKRAETVAMSTSTTLIPVDDTIPQITEGTEYLTLNITPTKATNMMEISVEVCVAHNIATAGNVIAAVFRDSGADAIASKVNTNPPTQCSNISLTFRIVAGSTIARTYRLRLGLGAAGTLTVNGTNAARIMGGTLVSSMTVREITV